jgi:hypothetical protein
LFALSKRITVLVKMIATRLKISETQQAILAKTWFCMTGGSEDPLVNEHLLFDCLLSYDN